MATYDLYSHSPLAASPYQRTPGPLTPIHSPHHSVHSSTSSRTPIHTLSIHEYRKQQGTPVSRVAPVPGRTLRRKASVLALNEIERAPSTKQTLRRDSHVSSRPLQPSYSAHQLAPPGSYFGTPAVSEHVYRSQSSEPRAQSGSISSLASADSLEKVRYFSNRKRLPRPSAPTDSGLRFAHNLPSGRTRQTRSTLPAPLTFLTEESNASDAQTTPTLSLSRFPQPPHFETLRESQREKAVSFGTAAPVTPPATPATIHYRGASFDLVNPHASLPYHNIVTPSRDFDSSDFLPVQSLRDSQSSSEMAPKRPLYGDLNAAHAGIVRRVEDANGSAVFDLPLPPTPAAISPGSSTYTSPAYSPESRLAPSPLAVRRSPAEARFSIKQLTRTLTKKLTGPPEYTEAEEFQQLRGSNANRLSLVGDEEPLRTLEKTFIPTDRSSYFPISPVSPISPTSPASSHDLGYVSGDNGDGIECLRKQSQHSHNSRSMASMVPDDFSKQIGRGSDRSGSAFVKHASSRPYYDDLASLYASSSIYTEDDRRRSAYQQDLMDNRKSSGLLYYSGEDVPGIANLHSSSDLGRNSHQMAALLPRDSHLRSRGQDDGKTDTLSKLIEQYVPENAMKDVSSTDDPESANTTNLVAPYTSDDKDDLITSGRSPTESVPGFSQFEFGLFSSTQRESINPTGQHVSSSSTSVRERILSRPPGLPPSSSLPQIPVSQDGQGPRTLSRPDLSEVFSDASNTSYGDTQNLLQLPDSEMGGLDVPAETAQPSSSYSQLDTKVIKPSSSYSQPENHVAPQTPQEALDQAEIIFDNAAAQQENSPEDIPALWGRRSSLHLLRNKRLTDGSAHTSETGKVEWETVAGASNQGRLSLDSIADYSSSEGSRDSLGFIRAASLPSWTDQDHARENSFYSHPSPIRGHTHPFSLSPPQLTTHPTVRTAPDVTRTNRLSSPVSSSTVPIFRIPNTPRPAVDEPNAFAPWALNDKETQELLASGPNDDILFGSDDGNRSRHLSQNDKSHEQMSEHSSLGHVDSAPGLERENTFAKFTILGPKGNLTGTPQGTGMQEVGSSLADTSSPGARLYSSSSPHSPRPDYGGFYASPFPAVGSVTRIEQSSSVVDPQLERTPSEVTLFPSSYNTEPVQCSSPLVGVDRRRSLKNTTVFKPARRTSRSAVPGQTRLRHMVLSPETRSTVSSKDTHFSRFISAGGSERPSTSDTATPLRRTRPSLDTFPVIRSGKPMLVHQHSPHLLIPVRKVNEEDEARRRKLSWLIFACFCILPPCMFLYRRWGDTIIVSVTEGELGHCTAQSKRAALIAGIVVNISLIAALLIPVLVAQALKAI